MILRSVLLRDFGLYGGSRTLDLLPRRGPGGSVRPVVLVGGQNGTGKTTLLEAIRLALYGRRALGARVSQSDYEAYLRARVHRGAGAIRATVGLEFDYAEAGTVHRYKVARAWSLRGKRVSEELSLEKDGEPVTTVPREEWHSFLQELIPPGVSQLFFFDGEKIQQIAEGEDDNEQLAEAIRGLLGIDLVARLRIDLGLHIAKHKREDSGGNAGRLEALEQELAATDARIARLAEEVAELTSIRDSQARAAEQIRRRFVAEGGAAAAQKARLEARRDDLQERNGRALQDLRALANGLLPFALAPGVVGRFRAALARAGSESADGGVAPALEAAVRAWRTADAPERRAAWRTEHWEDLTRLIRSLQPSQGAGAAPCPAFLEVGDGTAALARLAEADAVARPRASALCFDLDRTARELDEVERALERADNAAAGLFLDELQNAERRLGATEASLRQRDAERAAARGRRVTVERERRRLLDAQDAAAAAAGRTALAARVQKALAAYESRLLEQKLERLRGEFVQRFGELARKQDLVADIRIDRETFATTLVSVSGTEVPKSALSAGEKQIYAIAMLWALARTSGRPLPMIIDTPLGRLDSEHRSRLVERYFPSASHQVVLLSTDTEIEGPLLAALGPSVSHSYRLEYDTRRQATSAPEGYFGHDQAQGGDRRELQQA